MKERYHSIVSRIPVLAIVMLIVCSQLVSAQDYAFKVLAFKGANEYKTGEEWKPLKTGTILMKDDEIKLTEGAYVGLMHHTGKPVEMKEPGSFKVSGLEENLKPGAGVMTKYADFILSSNSAETKKNRLSATGAVSRDIAQPLSLILPENQNSSIFNSTAIISWEGSKVDGPYSLTIRNMFDDVLDRFDTAEKRFTVDFSRFPSQNALIVQVHSKSSAKEASKDHLIKKLSPAEQERIRKSLEAISQELNEPTALNKLILAGFYEEHKLLIDAITAYEEAIRLAPDVPSYQEAYDDFLVRNNISR
jgi:hypothetical protein